MEDFFRQQADFVKIWQENQEEMTKRYAGWTEKMMEDFFGNKEEAGYSSKGWLDAQKAIMENFRELGDRMNLLVPKGDGFTSQYLKPMNFQFFEENYRNFLANMKAASGVPLTVGDTGAWPKADSLFQSFLEQGHPLSSAFGMQRVTDAISQTIGIMQGSWGQGREAFFATMREYQDIMCGLSGKATALVIDGLVENLGACKEQVEKYLSAPPLGLNREIIQEVAKGLELSMDYVLAYGKLAKVTDAATCQASTTFRTKLSEMAANKEPVTKFTDLFALWTKESEPVLIEFLRSEEFAKSQGDFIDAGHRLSIQWTRLAEKMLEPTPIALKRDLDLAIAEIHRLKRDMRSLRQEVKEERPKAPPAAGSPQIHDDGGREARAALKTAAAARKGVKKVEPKLRP